MSEKRIAVVTWCCAKLFPALFSIAHSGTVMAVGWAWGWVGSHSRKRLDTGEKVSVVAILPRVGDSHCSLDRDQNTDTPNTSMPEPETQEWVGSENAQAGMVLSMLVCAVIGINFWSCSHATLGKFSHAGRAFWDHLAQRYSLWSAISCTPFFHNNNEVQNMKISWESQSMWNLSWTDFALFQWDEQWILNLLRKKRLPNRWIVPRTHIVLCGTFWLFICTCRSFMVTVHVQVTVFCSLFWNLSHGIKFLGGVVAPCLLLLHPRETGLLLSRKRNWSFGANKFWIVLFSPKTSFPPQRERKKKKRKKKTDSKKQNWTKIWNLQKYSWFKSLTHRTSPTKNPQVNHFISKTWDWETEASYFIIFLSLSRLWQPKEQRTRCCSLHLGYRWIQGEHLRLRLQS